MLNKDSFKQKIEQVLHEMNAYSEEAVQLLLGTCAQESAFGTYRKQLGGGPALGVFQMEPATFNDIKENYLKYKPALESKIMLLSNVTELKADDLVENDALAICMARTHYMRVRAGIPANLQGQAEYWKKYYNTPLGKGKVEEYIANYNKYVK